MHLANSEVIAMAEKNIELTYKGRPLRRMADVLYHGSMADKYIVMLKIMETKKIEDMDVATKVAVSLQLTDESVKYKDRVLKKSEKDNLYSAMDVGAVWLERALASK